MMIEDIVSHFFIMRGTNDVPDKYWKQYPDIKPEERLKSEIESYTNQQISKVVSEIEDKLPEKYYGRHDKNTYECGYSEALDQVHKVLERYKK